MWLTKSFFHGIYYKVTKEFDFCPSHKISIPCDLFYCSNIGSHQEFRNKDGLAYKKKLHVQLSIIAPQCNALSCNDMRCDAMGVTQFNQMQCLSPLQRLLLVNNSERKNGSGPRALEGENGSASLFPSTQPLRVFLQACNQGATVGGRCDEEKCNALR